MHVHGFDDGGQYCCASKGDQGPGDERLVFVFCLGGMVDADRHQRCRFAGGDGLFPDSDRAADLLGRDRGPVIAGG